MTDHRSKNRRRLAAGAAALALLVAACNHDDESIAAEGKDTEEDSTTTTTSATQTTPSTSGPTTTETTEPAKPSQTIRFGGPDGQTLEEIDDVTVEISQWNELVVSQPTSVETDRPATIDIVDSPACELVDGQPAARLSSTYEAGQFCTIVLTAEGTDTYADTAVKVTVAIVPSDEQYWQATGVDPAGCYPTVEAVPDLVIEAAADQGDQVNSVEWVIAAVTQPGQVSAVEDLSPDTRRKTVSFELAPGVTNQPTGLAFTVRYSIPSTGIAGGTPPQPYKLTIGGC